MEEESELSQQIRSFLFWLSHERRSPQTTVSTYEQSLHEFYHFALREGFPLDAQAIRPAMVRSWLASLYSTQKPSTIARKLSALRSFYRFLHRKGYLTHNPVATIRTPKVPRDPPCFLSVEEACRTVEAPTFDEAREPRLRARDRAMLELLYGTGIRVSELARLEVGDVAIAFRRLRVLGKGNKERVLPFGPPAAEALEEWLVARATLLTQADPTTAALWLGIRGNPLGVRQIQFIVKRYGFLGT
ncbi:MAG: tyrosine-type recombinase/integrase, partial [Deltaproteobacteria bacterium]|nr:tyrosine-type recombinase/integrase [Deltaproteobacteria bacterium]